MKLNNETAQLSFRELTAIVEGKFKVRQCTSCFGTGWYYVDENGTIRDPSFAEAEEVSEFYEHICSFSDEECGGLGYHINIEGEE